MAFGEREVKNSITGDCSGTAGHEIYCIQARRYDAQSNFVTGYVTGSCKTESVIFLQEREGRKIYRLPFPLRILLK